MSATVDYLVKQAAVILNASTGTGSGDSSTIGAIDDPKKFPFSFLSGFALDADAEVNMLLAQTVDHPLLQALIASTGSLSDGATITASGGGTVYQVLNVQVDGVDARRKAVTYFKRLASDPLSRTTIGKYYDLQGGGRIIRHNGTSAICKVIRFLKSGAPQAPDELTNAVVACLLSMATPKMDTWISMASYFAQQWAMRQQMIRSGEISIPQVIAYQMMERGAA